ncbi:MAG: hypothetical protein JWN87_1520, partial [Frankiales bacterium]|nr:hypothetical protein [Frankiales bacterium]
MPDAPSTPPGRVDGSMSLLVDMTAAARRDGERRAVAEGAAPVRRRTVVPLLVLLGVLTGTAAAQVRGQ